MSIASPSLRPNKVSLGTGPIYYSFITDRGYYSESLGLVAIQFNSMPPNGATIDFAGKVVTFDNTANTVYDTDKFNRTGIASLSELADAFACFMNRSGELNEYTNETAALVGPGATGILFSWDETDWPPAIVAKDPGGLAYGPGGDIEVTFPNQYFQPQGREAYRLILEAYIQEEYLGQYVKAPRLTVPFPNPKKNEAQGIDFELQAALQPYLSFDLPNLDSVEAQTIRLALRKFYVRWAERFTRNTFATGGQIGYKWFYDKQPFPSSPEAHCESDTRTFYILNARFDEWDSIIRQDRAFGCLGVFEYPDPLAPYFIPQPLGLRFWLNDSLKKLIYPGAYEWLNVWGEGLDLDSIALQVDVKGSEAEGTYYIDYNLANTLACPAPEYTQRSKQLFSLPLHRLWALLELELASSLCVRLVELSAGTTEEDQGQADLQPAQWGQTCWVGNNTPGIYTLQTGSPGSYNLELGYEDGLSPALQEACFFKNALVPVTFETNTTYLLTISLRVFQDMFTGTGAVIYPFLRDRATGEEVPRGSTLVNYHSRNEWKEGIDPYNTSLTLSLLFTTNDKTDFFFALYLKQAQITNTSGGRLALMELESWKLEKATLQAAPKTNWLEYQLESPVCGENGEGLTFLYQNRFGLPEGFHLLNELGESLEVERRLAEKKLDRHNKQAPRLWDWQRRQQAQYYSRTWPLFTYQESRVKSYRMEQAKEFYSSNQVYLIETETIETICEETEVTSPGTECYAHGYGPGMYTELGPFPEGLVPVNGSRQEVWGLGFSIRLPENLSENTELLRLFTVNRYVSIRITSNGTAYAMRMEFVDDDNAPGNPITYNSSDYILTPGEWHRVFFDVSRKVINDCSGFNIFLQDPSLWIDAVEYPLSEVFTPAGPCPQAETNSHFNNIGIGGTQTTGAFNRTGQFDIRNLWIYDNDRPPGNKSGITNTEIQIDYQATTEGVEPCTYLEDPFQVSSVFNPSVSFELGENSGSTTTGYDWRVPDGLEPIQITGQRMGGTSYVPIENGEGNTQIIENCQPATGCAPGEKQTSKVAHLTPVIVTDSSLPVYDNEEESYSIEFEFEASRRPHNFQ